MIFVAAKIPRFFFAVRPAKLLLSIEVSVSANHLAALELCFTFRSTLHRDIAPWRECCWSRFADERLGEFKTIITLIQTGNKHRPETIHGDFRCTRRLCKAFPSIASVDMGEFEPFYCSLVLKITDGSRHIQMLAPCTSVESPAAVRRPGSLHTAAYNTTSENPLRLVCSDFSDGNHLVKLIQSTLSSLVKHIVSINPSCLTKSYGCYTAHVLLGVRMAHLPKADFLTLEFLNELLGHFFLV